MLDFNTVLQEFLAFREWEDKVFFNTEIGKWYVDTNVGVNNQPIRLIIEGSNETQILSIFLYFNISVVDIQRDQFAKLCNWVNMRQIVGHFEFLENGMIRWVSKFDCERTKLAAFTISVNVQHGWESIEQFWIPITSVALGHSDAESAANLFSASQDIDRSNMH